MDSRTFNRPTIAAQFKPWACCAATASLWLVALLILVPVAMAQVPGKTAIPATQDRQGPLATANTVTTTQPRTATKPAWKDLTAKQQEALQPLASSWSSFGPAQKRKWLALSLNYPTLPTEEQTKLQSRMTDWVKLSQKERVQARLNFAESQRIVPSDRTASWLAYQALSPEEKKKLATSAKPKETGGAIAVQPIAPEKLVSLPSVLPAADRPVKIGVDPRGIDLKTLLPLPPAEPTAVIKNQNTGVAI